MSWKIVVHPDTKSELEQLPVDIRARLACLLDLIGEVGPYAFIKKTQKTPRHAIDC